MSPHVTSSIVALKTITLVLGGLITYFSYKAYVRTTAEPLRYLSIGFGIVTVGSLLAGIVHQVLLFLEAAPAGLDPGSTAILVESALTAVGFAVIVYSLYSE